MPVEPEMIFLSDILLPRNPVKTNHAATKGYVDTQIATVSASSPELGTAATVNTGTTEGTIPVLGVNGKLAISVLPAAAITNTFVVASEAAMLALSAEEGDVAIRSDLNKTFILAGDDPTDLSDWKELLTPTDAVSSVNGQTGAVSITLAELGAASASHEHSDLYIPNIILGMPGGVATLDGNGAITIDNLPTESTLTDSASVIPTSAAVYSAVSTHTAATSAHNATATPTANRIALYDANGLLSSGTPTADTHVATKSYVDNAAGGGRYRTTFSGNGTDTQIPITHNLGTKEVSVQVFHASGVSDMTGYTNYAFGTDGYNMETESGGAYVDITMPDSTVQRVNLTPTMIDENTIHWTGTKTGIAGAYTTITWSHDALASGTEYVYPNNNPTNVSCVLSSTSDPTFEPVQVAFIPTSINALTLSFVEAPGTEANGHSYIAIVRKV